MCRQDVLQGGPRVLIVNLPALPTPIILRLTTSANPRKYIFSRFCSGNHSIVLQT